MNDPYNSRDNHIRIGDGDRDYAIRILGVHFADGRITLAEYDDRCQLATGAATRTELDQLFVDLPALTHQRPETSMEVYSTAEIEEQRRRGANPRAGIMALTSIISVGAYSVFESISAVASNAILLVIPVVAILLYVLKVGPSAWYTPSPRSLERARAKRLRLAHQLQLEERKAQRKIKQAEITTDALNLTHRAMKKADRTIKNSQEKWRNT